MRTVFDSCWRTLGLLALAATTSGSAVAAGLAVHVVDRRGDAVADVAVYLMPIGETAVVKSRQRMPAIATMEQVNNMFVPHLLVVEAGTPVNFPNNDTVSHHVYSFSEAKTFQLDLYKGNVHPPQIFDRPGLVVLGCNIHDSMLAYILVVDTPWSAITGESGDAEFTEMPTGTYDLFVWTPRSDPKDLPAPQSLVIDDAESPYVSVQLTGKLSPPHGGVAGSLSWQAY